MKTVIFGGTFDPIHNGHVKLALDAKKMLCADKFMILPNYLSPHKYKCSADAGHRLKMCKLAFENFDDMEVSDLEIKRGEPSYTVDTIREIKNMYPDSELTLLMGSDMFLKLESFKDCDEIFKMADICVASRTQADDDKVKEHAKRLRKMGVGVIIMEFEPIKVSSSDIRCEINGVHPENTQVPPNVFDYIKENNLYFN